MVETAKQMNAEMGVLMGALEPFEKEFKPWGCPKCYSNFDRKKEFKRHFGQCKEQKDMLSIIKLLKSSEDGDESAIKLLRETVTFQ